MWAPYPEGRRLRGSYLEKGRVGQVLKEDRKRFQAERRAWECEKDMRQDQQD